MKKHAVNLTICVLILGMLGWWVHDEWKYRAQIKRHAELKTLSAFMEHGVEHRFLYTLSRNGEAYLYWALPLPKSLVVFPSGSACYIFDSSGNMVDYTSDAGDDPYFQKKWCPSEEERQALDSPHQFLSEKKE